MPALAQPPMRSTLRWWHRLGPGLLFAGSAIGVSHIYQSTRAGAEYGLGLLIAVIAANAFKYPFFEFGPRYALATGESLLAGYKRLGYAVLVLYLLLTLATVFTVQAAVTGVTAALLQHVLGTAMIPWHMSALVLLVSAVLLLAGRYRLLDSSMKVIVILLSVATLFAAAAAFSQPALPAPGPFKTFRFSDPLAVIFLIGLMGWMPAPIDLSVWHSVWALEKRRTQPDFSLRDALFDFRVGYAGTAVLAVVFLLLGARMLYGRTPDFPSAPADFSALLIDLYRSALGPWAGVAIAVAALATMFSTTLTVLDAMPRVLRQSLLLLGEGPRRVEQPASEKGLHFAVQPASNPKPASKLQPATLPSTAFPDPNRSAWLYPFFLFVVAGGGLLLIRSFAADLRSLVDLATLLSFLTAPFFALANYALVTGKHTPEAARPGRALRLLSWLGMLYLAGFSVYFLVMR